MNFTQAQVEKGDPEVGKWLFDEMESCRTAVSGLTARWSFNESVGRNDPANAGKKIYDNWSPRAVPVLSAHMDRIVRTTVGSVTAPKPWVQAVPDDDDQEGADDLENGLQTIVEKAGFERKLRKVARTALYCGFTHFRVRLTEKGVKFESVHPNDFVVAPLFIDDLRNAHLVGHRFYLPRWQVRDYATRQDGEAYYHLLKEEDVDGLPSTSPDQDPSGHDPAFSRTESDAPSSDTESELIELWELLARPMVGKDRKWCRFVICPMAGDKAMVFLYEPYGFAGELEPYSRPWYFDVRFHDEEGAYIPAGSVSQDVIGLCLSVQDNINLAQVGEAANVATPVVISGGSLGKKIKSVTLGQVIETINDVKVQAFPSTFDSSRIIALNDHLDNRIQAQTGVSQSRLSSEYLSSQTATATAAAEGAASQNEGDRPRFLADCIEPIYDFIKNDLVRLHAPTFRRVYGKALSEGFYTACRKSSVTFVATGKDANHLPHILIPKLMVAKQIAMEPGSDYSPRRVNDAIMNRLDLGIDLDKLRKDDEEKLAEAQAAQAQMAALQGDGGMAAAQAPTGGAGPQQAPGGPGGALPLFGESVLGLPEGLA